MKHKWDKKRSEWYCRAVEQSDYPEKAVSLLKPLLKECGSVMDIGAGCGALSLPLARKVKKVTALEPSKWMYDLLLKRVSKAGVRNIRAYKAGWKRTGLKGDLPLAIKPHDMVICANLPYSVICSNGFLRYISKISKKYIVYIHGAGHWNRFYYDDLYPALFKRKYAGEGDYLNTYEFLHRHGIFADIRIFEFNFDQPFEDFDDALDFWRHRLKTALTMKKEKILADFLRKKLVKAARGSALTAPFGPRRAALMWWRP